MAGADLQLLETQQPVDHRRGKTQARTRIRADGTMRVTREPRGWVPRGPAGQMYITETFHRVGR